MDGLPLPTELSMKIFCLLNHHNLATAHQVCRNWKVLASDNILWCNLFKQRWGEGHAAFCAPLDCKSWKSVYEVQDRCDRVGLGLKIISEGGNCYLVYQGSILQYLCSRDDTEASNSSNLKRGMSRQRTPEVEESGASMLDNILNFIGDLEVASNNAKRKRVL